MSADMGYQFRVEFRQSVCDSEGNWEHLRNVEPAFLSNNPHEIAEKVNAWHSRSKWHFTEVVDLHSCHGLPTLDPAVRYEPVRVIYLPGEDGTSAI